MMNINPAALTATETNLLPPAEPTHIHNPHIAEVRRSWNYLEKMIASTRLLLTAAAKNFTILSFAGRCFPEKVDNLTAKIKLLSALSLPFNIANLTETVSKYIQSFHLHDQVGLTFETFSLAQGIATTYDNLSMFINSLIQLSRSSLKPMPTISVPISLLLTSLDTVIIFSKFEKTNELRKALNQDLNSKNREEYLRKLREVIKWYVASEEIKFKKADNPILKDLLERKKIELLRFISPETLPELELLLDFINQHLQAQLISEKSFEKIMLQLKKVLGQLEQRMKVELISLCAHALFIIALLLFLEGYAAALPFVLLSLGLELLILHDATEELSTHHVA